MKKILYALLCSVFMLTMFLNINIYSNNKDISVQNDEEMTQKKYHPVIIVTNNSDKDINVTYDFYLDDEGSEHYANELLVKAKSSVSLDLPQLHSLGDSKGSRRVWFSWSNEKIMKPIETQIETSIFTNEPKGNELGLN